MIDLTFHVQENYVEIVVEGANTFGEFTQAATAYQQHANFSASQHRLCDFRDADMTGIGTLDVLRFVRFCRKLPTKRSTRIALVGKEQREFLFMFLNTMTPFEIKYFDLIESAIEWITSAAESDGKTTAKPVSEMGIKLHRVDGDFSSELALNLQAEWHADPEFDPGVPVLWDLTQARCVSDMNSVVSGAQKLSKTRAGVGNDNKIAIVIGSRQQSITIHHAYRDITDERGISLFSDFEAAETWLRSA